jgi:hypothetical protein
MAISFQCKAESRCSRGYLRRNRSRDPQSSMANRYESTPQDPDSQYAAVQMRSGKVRNLSLRQLLRQGQEALALARISGSIVDTRLRGNANGNAVASDRCGHGIHRFQQKSGPDGRIGAIGPASGLQPDRTPSLWHDVPFPRRKPLRWDGRPCPTEPVAPEIRIF